MKEYIEVPRTDRRYKKYLHNDILTFISISKRNFLPEGDSRSLSTISSEINRSIPTIMNSIHRLQSDNVIKIKKVQYPKYSKKSVRHQRKLYAAAKNKTFLVHKDILNDVIKKDIQQALFDLYLFVKQKAYARIQLKKLITKTNYNYWHLWRLLKLAEEKGLLKQKGKYIYAAISYHYFRTSLTAKSYTEPSSIINKIAFSDLMNEIVRTAARKQPVSADKLNSLASAVTTSATLPIIPPSINETNNKIPPIVIILAAAYYNWLNYRYPSEIYKHSIFELLKLKTILTFVVSYNIDNLQPDIVIDFVLQLEKLKRNKYFQKSDKHLPILKAYRYQIAHMISKYLAAKRYQHPVEGYDSVEEVLKSAPVYDIESLTEEKPKKYQHKEVESVDMSWEEAKAKILGIKPTEEVKIDENKYDDELDELLAHLDDDNKKEEIDEEEQIIDSCLFPKVDKSEIERMKEILKNI